MQENSPFLNEEERLKNENEFLKMKLMLEKGAEFSQINEAEIDAQTENDFLNYVAEFERQSANPVYIKVFDKIGRPDQFKPVSEISEAEIGEAWKELSNYLNLYQIELNVCSPNIPMRELYRFTIEELFEHEMDDMNIPGMMTCFIYDEFHPDPVYDNTRTSTEDCINLILAKKPLEWLYNFRTENLRLNTIGGLSADEFGRIVNRFKSRFDDLALNGLASTNCLVQEEECIVTGNYSLFAAQNQGSKVISGNWKVFFELDKEHGYWNIIAVDIEGIDF